MRRLPSLAVPLFFLAGLMLFACGCQKAFHTEPTARAAYTKRHAIVRAAPSPTARAVVSVGPNVRVLPLERAGDFVRVSIDDGRATGWVEASVLSSTTVAEPKPGRRPSRPKASAPRTPNKTPAATPSQPVGAVEAPQQPATAQAPAETTSAPSQEAAIAPVTPAPAPQQSVPSTSHGGEAQAATISAPKPTPAPAPAMTAPAGRQARPEAFDPF